jgi:Ca2+-binding RTX toxin-like protein
MTEMSPMPPSRPAALTNADLDEVVGGVGAPAQGSSTRGISAEGGAGADTMTGTAGGDVLWGQGGNDSITAGAGDDLVAGGAGNDTISGGSGRDDVWDGAGDDLTYGDDGADNIFIGNGADTAFGGEGNDVFVWRAGGGSDVIDGGEGRDTLDLRGLDRGLLAFGAVQLDGQVRATSGPITMSYVNIDAAGNLIGHGYEFFDAAGNKVAASGTITIGSETIRFTGIERVSFGRQ